MWDQINIEIEGNVTLYRFSIEITSSNRISSKSAVDMFLIEKLDSKQSIFNILFPSKLHNFQSAKNSFNLYTVI